MDPKLVENQELKFPMKRSILPKYFQCVVTMIDLVLGYDDESTMDELITKLIGKIFLMVKDK